jgi:hypothetical protein
MTKLKLAITVVLALGLAVTALAGCPDSGYYRTSNNTILPGRVSEAWCAGGPGQPGNTENAMSWGPDLGTQWKVWGQAIDAAGAVEVNNTVDTDGNGYIDYATNYTGGQFWLSGTHIWSLDGQPITGALTYYNVATRVQIVGGQAVAANSNVFFDGVIDDCEDCVIAYTIANAELIWSSDFGTPAPADYPALLCDAPSGELFDACCITMAITCGGVATDSQTWGHIKTLYR